MKKLTKVLWQVLATVLIFGFATLSLTGCDDLFGKDDTGSSAIIPEEIRLNSSELTLLIGGTETLTATVLPANATNKAVNWNSSNSQVATVASNGAVTGLSLGTTTIIATTTDGGKVASCAVSVIEKEGIEPANISLFPSSLTMNIGDTDNLIVTVAPSNAAKDVYWKSENPAVVVVEPDGKITATGEGTAAVYALSVVGGKQASSVITVNPLLIVINPVNKYETISDTSEDINDRIKYSVSYGDIDYYYIYLGEMRHIPLFYYAAYNHDGMASSYSVSRTETTKETIETTVAESSQTAVTVSENYSTSSTTGGKISTEISRKYTVNVKFSGKILGVGTEGGGGYEKVAKNAAESYWSTVSTTGGGTSSQNSKSLTNTVKNGTEKTESTQETRTWNFTKSDKTGWYRYTLFSASDIYLYVVRDRTVPGEIYYEFREHVIPDACFWKLDYSDKASFTKDDKTEFNFEASMLDSLPDAKTDITPPSLEITFISNGGNSVPNQTVNFSGKATRPADPTWSGHIFGGWYTDNDYFKNLYDFSTPVLGNITLYAKWDAIIWTVSFNANGGSGTVPSAQNVKSNSSISLPYQGGLTRSDFSFIGWSANSTGTGTIYGAGWSFTPTSNITLYANWVRTSISAEINNVPFSIYNTVRLWSINTSSFDIPKLKSAGYKNFVILLEYNAIQTASWAINAKMSVALRKSNGANYNSVVVVPEKKVLRYSLGSTVSLDNFDSLTVRWETSTGGTTEIGNRKVTITAYK